MNKFQPARVLGVLGIAVSSLAFAQNYQTMPIASGFNEDVIANGTGPALSSTSAILDGDSFAFVARDFLATATSTPITYGVPTNGIINSVVTSTPGLSYQLADLNSPNSLKLSNANLTGTVTFATPKQAIKLYMLSTSGSALSTLTITVNFSDGTTQQATGVSIPDWYNGTNFAIQGLGRINRNTNDLEPAGGTNPRMYQSAINIDAANQTKFIQSVTITKTNTTVNGYPNIFAFSADAYSDCLPPTLNAVGTLTQNTADVSWTPATGTTATTYQIYYSTTNTAPTSASTPNLTGITGNSTTIPGLTPNTIYYYWVRANCSTATAQSAWSFSGTFKTLCGPVTSLSENFDSYGTGNIVPDCWVRNFVNGTMSISTTTPASGTRNIYQTNTSAQTPSTVVLPEFSNINAGTHWLRFKARVTVPSGTLNVGYVTNPTDASTFTLLQALTINNSAYTSPDAEYGVVVPATVPANARLAIRNTADGKLYYWDDVYWEPKPSCFAPSGLSSSNVQAYSATISWIAPSTAPASGYEYYYSTTNTAPTATTVPLGTSTTLTAPLNGLASATNYFVWVRSACSTIDKSTWYGPVTFTTACATFTAPFTQTFDNGTIPNCWTNANPSSTNIYLLWMFSGSAGYGASLANNGRPAGTYAWVDASVPYTGAGTNTIYLTTPQISLAGLSSPYISFEWFKNHSTSATTTVTPSTYDDNNLTVEVNDGNGWVTFFSEKSNANTWRTVGIDLPASYVGATIQVRFNVNKNVNGNSYFYDDVLLDNIEVKQNPTLSTNDVVGAKKAVKVYPNPFNDIINISEFKDIKSIRVSDVSGRTLKTIENPEAQINLSNLNAGLYILNLQFKDGSQKSVKVIKK
ncbi:fibronectin type III domain-containing protein [Chryseobacterium caseinilyticum]|uniref:Fibronectin type III domain-containing protein n=1 Tax=Chryseobacterium caseinilyticum TaxID=2771428 RepID=A0ABR8ZCI4_9FLAO|nr:fibronectin type III domain-containing protein [Chryseobacterium caseinilyticum]MBD8082558.1 fibronectin type III domain-containing protein [Chryseobacterium caseinilyticum]